jgi:hypothetical protein
MRLVVDGPVPKSACCTLSAQALFEVGAARKEARWPGSRAVSAERWSVGVASLT